MSDSGKRVNPVTQSAADIVAAPVSHPEFDAFVATIRALRAPDGCPWDKEQTHRSIASNMIEEAYEAVDAIESDDTAHMREELGDVLLQVVLQSQIAEEEGEFTLREVCEDVNAKIVRRHPHVFGEVEAGDANEVLELWDAVKLAEKQGADADGPARREGLLDGVPVAFPALLQAQKISRKAASAGFEWESIPDIWKKVFEEIGELNDAYAAAGKSASGKMLKDADPEAYDHASLEFGDVLFSLVNVARRMGIDAESALRDACSKFRTRWAFMEGAAEGMGRRIEDLSIDEQENLWQAAKVL